MVTNVTTRTLEPGTTGWSIDDLDDPAVRHAWDEGRFEITRGVLTKRAPPNFGHSVPSNELVYLLRLHFDRRGELVRLGSDVDLVIAHREVYRPDLLLMTEADMEAQRRAVRAWSQREPMGSLFVPPTLVVESLSRGHESHDLETKREAYARFGVPNYWLVNHRDRSLQCLILRDGAYEADVAGGGDETVEPTAFPGLTIPIGRLFA